jgi:lipopolysaccharide transport system ATP-binding protein
MTKIVIHAEGLGKSYHRGALQQNELLRDHLSRMLKSPLSVFRRAKSESFWALKNFSLKVHEGEVLGLIGRNGAGKTTLLKILSRITRPTTGWAEIHGRIGSLLEVGTGFHPELTGRENTFLSGAILGMSKREITRKFDEIVAFAELEKFIDTPVKHYSSGMYVRLAFGVAAHLEPEILLVDEVLAVGDVQFQRKCLGKMGEVASHGRTIVFVSHNMAAMQNLCDRVMWLDQGSLLQDGPAASVISAYLAQSARPPSKCFWPVQAAAPGNEMVRIRKISVHPDNGNAADDKSDADSLTVRTPLVIQFEYWNLLPDTRLSLSLHIYNGEGIRAFNTFPLHEPLWNVRAIPAGLYRSSCYIPGDLLNVGTYRVQLLVVRDQSVEIFNMEDALVFEVQEARFEAVKWYGKIFGVVRPALRWKTELLEGSDLEPREPFSVTSSDQNSGT